MHTTGVQPYTLEGDTGNGALPVWDDVIFMQEMVEDVNADELGVFGWVTTPGIKARLKLTPRLGNTIGLPVWTDDGTIDGIQAGSTNQLPKIFFSRRAGNQLSACSFTDFRQSSSGCGGTDSSSSSILPLEEAGNDRAHDLRDGRRRGTAGGSRVRRRFLLQTRLSRSAPNLARGSGSSRVFDRGVRKCWKK